jgi:hypothetical protein
VIPGRSSTFLRRRPGTFKLGTFIMTNPAR